MSATDRLYGEPGDEQLHDTFDAAVEIAMDRRYPDESGSLTIEEHSVHPPQEHLPTADHVLEHIQEWVCDSGWSLSDEGFYYDTERACSAPEVKQVAERLLAEIAGRITYRMAAKVVATHTVEWAVDSESVARVTNKVSR